MRETSLLGAVAAIVMGGMNVTWPAVESASDYNVYKTKWSRGRRRYRDYAKRSSRPHKGSKAAKRATRRGGNPAVQR
jgi:hypothetical protein